mgnify:CR=1 FL=1
MDLKPVAEIRESTHSDGLTVWVTYPNAGVDRPRTFGISVKRRSIAERLEKAINDGVAVTNQKIVKDELGQTYVEDENQVLGRRLNADLKRLGY